MENPNLQKRMNMVKNQIQARGINSERVLNALRKVPREEFVPAQYSALAYEDAPINIGSEQTISQPYVVALMTDKLNISKTDKVLEVGTGSGYQTAILAELAGEVFSIERIKSLSLTAQKVLESLSYNNIHFRVGDGFLGWKEAGPFNCIILTAAPINIPSTLIDQLALGGRIIAPIGSQSGQKLQLLTKGPKEIKKEELIPVRFVPMLPDTIA